MHKNILSNSNKLESICEHIPFNLSLINKGYCNYISKYMYVDYNERISFIYFIAIYVPSFLIYIYRYLKNTCRMERRNKEIVFLQGGLGNQMFQYAFYLAKNILIWMQCMIRDC